MALGYNMRALNLKMYGVLVKGATVGGFNPCNIFWRLFHRICTSVIFSKLDYHFGSESWILSLFLYVSN